LTLFNIFLPHFNDFDISKPSVSNSETTKELPSDLTMDILNKTIYKVKTDYNHSDWTEFYNVFGDFAKAQINIEDLEQEFKKLIPVTGKISTYAYSHYTYKGSEDNAEWFKIYYKCRFDNGKGTIKISTRTVNGKSEVIGINIVLDEI
jgi:hypothetical protein